MILRNSHEQPNLWPWVMGKLFRENYGNHPLFFWVEQWSSFIFGVTSPPKSRNAPCSSHPSWQWRSLTSSKNQDWGGWKNPFQLVWVAQWHVVSWSGGPQNHPKWDTLNVETTDFDIFSVTFSNLFQETHGNTTQKRCHTQNLCRSSGGILPWCPKSRRLYHAPTLEASWGSPRSGRANASWEKSTMVSW